jgi:hypothetical protein
LGVILLHLLIPSLLNFYHWSPSFARWQRFLAHIVDLHARIVGPFTARPVTTFVIESIGAATTLSPWWSFILAQLLFLTAAAYALARLSERLDSDPLFTLATFFLSFTVLFSFVTPNDSYDEAAQYLFLFLSLNALLLKRDASFALLYFFALLARETSALLLPGLIVLGWESRKSAWKFALPVAAFALYYLTRNAAPDPNRFLYWARNFKDIKTTFESLVSLCMALALPVALYGSTRRLGSMRAHAPWLRAFFLGVALNSPVIFFFAYARESRLFALPLVFLWPLCGAWVQRILATKRESALGFGLEPKLGIALILSLIVTVLFYRPNYRFPGGYEILAPIYLLLLLLGCSLRRVSPPVAA